jgi:hypothetical protein
MAFSHRIATLTAVVAIPLGIAATSYALTDTPKPAEGPAKVELESGSPGPSPSGSPSGSPSASPSGPPGGEAVPRPSATDNTDDADDADDADDGPGDDG